MGLEEGGQNAAEQEREHAQGDHHFEDRHASAEKMESRSACVHGERSHCIANSVLALEANGGLKGSIFGCGSALLFLSV